MQHGLDWIKQNTPQDAVVFSSYPAGVYLFTGRHTLDLNNATHIAGVFTPTHSLNLDTQGIRGGPLVWTSENHLRTKQYYRFYHYDPAKKSVVRLRENWLEVDVVD